MRSNIRDFLLFSGLKKTTESTEKNGNPLRSGMKKLTTNSYELKTNSLEFVAVRFSSLFFSIFIQS